METITHRQMRNDSAEVLRRVEAGQSFAVTNSGEEVAWLVPPARPGTARIARRAIARGGFAALLGSPVDGPSNADILDELRDER